MLFEHGDGGVLAGRVAWQVLLIVRVMKWMLSNWRRVMCFLWVLLDLVGAIKCLLEGWLWDGCCLILLKRRWQFRSLLAWVL